MDALPLPPPHKTNTENHTDISSPHLNTFNFTFNHAMSPPTVNPSNAINAPSPPPPPHLSNAAAVNDAPSSMNHPSANPLGDGDDVSGRRHVQPASSALQLLPFPPRPSQADGDGSKHGASGEPTVQPSYIPFPGGGVSRHGQGNHALQKPNVPRTSSANQILPFTAHGDGDGNGNGVSSGPNPPQVPGGLQLPSSASRGGGNSEGLLPFGESFFTNSCRLAPSSAAAVPRSNSVSALVESPSFTQSPVTPLLFSSSKVPKAPQPQSQYPSLFLSSSNTAEIESPVSQHIQPAAPKPDKHGFTSFNAFSAFNTAAASAGFMPSRTSSSASAPPYPQPYSPLPLPLPLPLTNSYNNVLAPSSTTQVRRLPLLPPPSPTTNSHSNINPFATSLRSGSGAYQSGASNNSNINMPMIPVRKRPIPPCDDVSNVLLPFTSSSTGGAGNETISVRFENATPEAHGHISRDILPLPLPTPPPPPLSLSTSPRLSPPGELETIGVRYKTPIERIPAVENGKRVGELNLARCRTLPWYLKETELRIQRTLGLAGEMWQGPSTNIHNGNMRYRYPRGEDDVDTLLDEASVLEQGWYARLKASLSLQLEEIRASAMMCEAIMEAHLDTQRRYRSIPIEEVDRRMEYCRAKFLKCRLAVLEKYKTYVRALKWVHLSPQRVRRGSYTRIQNNILRLWLFTHFNDPYPTAQEKARLMQECRMNDTQISNWFINSRVRIWKPCLNAVSQSQAAQETVRQLEDNRERRSREQARAKRRRGTSGTALQSVQIQTPLVSNQVRLQQPEAEDGQIPSVPSGASSSSGTAERKVEGGGLVRRW